MNYTCYDLKMAMNSCLRTKGTLEERDRAREEWFAKKLARTREAQQAKAVDVAQPVEDARPAKELPRYPAHWGRPETREGFGTRGR